MPDNETNNNSLVPIHNTGLIKVGNIIKITDKVLKEYSERTLAVFYKSVIIGEQEWMVENLNIDHFRNGDPIPEAKTDEEWIKAGEEESPAWCYYDNKPENGEKYGKLYNWFAVKDPRGLAPEGWHIPSIKEGKKLMIYKDDKNFGGLKILETYGLEDKCINNESNFINIHGGYRKTQGEFYGIGDYEYIYWWSSTEDNTLFPFSLFGPDKQEGFPVRCLKDKI